jgi:putative nucleotidyltransferase with HDIG domain
MTTPPSARYEELARRLASALRGAQLYQPSHPLVARNIDALLATLRELHTALPLVAIGLVGEELVVADTPLPRTSLGLSDLMRRLQRVGIERISIERGVSADELAAFVQAVAALPARDSAAAAEADLPAWPHIRVGRLAADRRVAEGIGRDIATIRRLYAEAVKSAETLWDSAQRDGQPDLPTARHVIDTLAEAVQQNRTAVVALTAMKNYDNYTFTHMVNVSILTMGQARSLGIEGRLLRELGLSALMHDIGKVRTPLEILNKPDKLTDQEFAIMKRHVVDGAEILRRTPEMPALAPVVAFEHHLRLDGTGYPDGVRRGTLNLGTMICSIADVYDAMRSQRAYQQAFPTDRILAVLQRNDGTQFDQHLVRRFVQLLGIYPPGNLVRLSTGEVGVVLRVHALDPFRPRVRVLIGADGARLARPQDRNLWEEAGEDAPRIVCPLDPADYQLDPLAYL